MHLKQFSAVLLCLAVLLFARAASAGSLPDFTDLAASCGPAVVNINTERSAGMNGPEDMFGDMFRNMPPGFERFFRFGPRQGRRGPARKQKSLGSGFLISADGYIVTNNHVVANADVIRVTLDEKTYKGEPIKAKLVGSDEETDLALLKIDIKQDLPFLKFGNSDELKVGEWLEKYGESIYGTRRSEVRDGFDVVGTKKGDKTTYLHFLNPETTRFTFEPEGEIASVTYVGSGAPVRVESTSGGDETIIQIERAGRGSIDVPVKVVYK